MLWSDDVIGPACQGSKILVSAPTLAYPGVHYDHAVIYVHLFIYVHQVIGEGAVRAPVRPCLAALFFSARARN